MEYPFKRALSSGSTEDVEIFYHRRPVNYTTEHLYVLHHRRPGALPPQESIRYSFTENKEDFFCHRNLGGFLQLRILGGLLLPYKNWRSSIIEDPLKNSKYFCTEDLVVFFYKRPERFFFHKRPGNLLQQKAWQFSSDMEQQGIFCHKKQEGFFHAIEDLAVWCCHRIPGALLLSKKSYRSLAIVFGHRSIEVFFLGDLALLCHKVPLKITFKSLQTSLKITFKSLKNVLKIYGNTLKKIP